MSNISNKQKKKKKETSWGGGLCPPMGAGELWRALLVVFYGNRGGSCPPANTVSCSAVQWCVLALKSSHPTRQKELYSLLWCTASDQKWIRGTLHRGWGIQGAAVSLCCLLAQLCLRLLFDPHGAQRGAVQLDGAGVGAQGTEGVVIGTTEAAFQGGSGECPRLMISAERARAEVTEGWGGSTTNTAVMPRTFPASCRQEKSSVWRSKIWAMISNQGYLLSCLGLYKYDRYSSVHIQFRPFRCLDSYP